MSSPIRYAVVGAGWFGQAAVLPAFKNAKENSKLAAIVSGDAQKRAVLSSDYGVPTYSLEQYPELLASGSVDAVYLVSPNSIHKEQTILAAQSGIHVLCEKHGSGSGGNGGRLRPGWCLSHDCLPSSF